MALLDVIFDSEAFERSLSEKIARFPVVMEGGVRAIGKILLERVIENTPKPGDPDEALNIEYVRTGRLVGGWGKAGRELDVLVPYGSEADGDFNWIRTDNEIGFVADNNVPYAKAVEEIGAGLVVGVTWRGGRHMVENAVNNTRVDGTIERELGAVWRTL